MNRQLEIICPYCNNMAAYVDSETIYGRSYGMIYSCKGCDAYVGVHAGTNKPVGHLANKELRVARRKAHKYFDILWEAAVRKGRPKKEARAAAYKWLSHKMEHPHYLTHIGMFNLSQCENVIGICKPYAERYENLKWIL